MDNRYFTYECPPLMNDGRFITTYYDKRILDQHVKQLNKIDNSYDYKKFLQDNTNTIINNDRNIHNQVYTCTTNCKTPLSELK
jgi:hypothetical protein